MIKRSTTADKYRKLYPTKQWRTLRGTTLTGDHYLCQRGVVSLTLFYEPSNLEAVCWSCHSGAIQSEEVLGYDTTIGADGWLIDQRNPAAW